MTEVQDVSVAMGPPTMGFQGPIEWDGRRYIVQNLSVDAEYVKTMGLEVVQGRDFSPGRAADSTGILVNETAARIFGFQGKVGERIDPAFIPGNEPHTLLGIVKDFQNTSFYEPILPVFLFIAPAMFQDNLLLRLRPGARQPALDALRNLWRQFVPDYPFQYHFLAADLNSQYRPETRMAILCNYFSGLAIFLACLGLFGLAAFTAEQRTKEIGVRKVLGATVSNILMLLSKEFIVLVMLAAVIAFPVSYLIMRHWLQEFAYRTSMGTGLFVMAGAGVILLALAAVSSQALQAALKNPTETLRYE